MLRPEAFFAKQRLPTWLMPGGGAGTAYRCGFPPARRWFNRRPKGLDPEGVPMDELKLIALDADDLAVVSAHMQDAVVRREDLTYLPAEQRLVLLARRFDWEAPQTPRRRLTGLHFGRVMRAQTFNLPQSPESVLELLAVTFAPAGEALEGPGGMVELVFAGGMAIRLDVECIEAQMKDLGPIWEAVARPAHDVA